MSDSSPTEFAAAPEAGPDDDPNKTRQTKKMHDSGMSQLEIAEILGVGRTTLYGISIMSDWFNGVPLPG